MKYIKFLVIAALVLLVLWIDLPRPIPIKVTAFGYKIDTRIPVLAFNFQINDSIVRKEMKTQLGLDLKGGSHLVFEADISKVGAGDLEDAITSARDIIERRVNLFGVSEPEVRTVKSGDIYRIEVDLPGVNDVAQASALIGQTAQLHFKEKGAEKNPLATQSAQLSFLDINEETGLTGKDVKKATVVFDPQTGQPQVQLTFSKEGGALFAAITKKNIGEPVGIFLDDMIISAPTVQQEIRDGNAVISGNFRIEDAKQLATAINSGALPVPIKLVEQRSIGPSLGVVEVQRSMVAGIVGLGMVMVFMIAYYGRLGVIACMGLITYGLLNFAIFRAVPIVLTLPGVAGFLLSIGMAVDSNILIFERIKEEQRKGKSFESAIRIGFGR
nr:protein translocase subunit SecD [Candidatus Woesebacteria bacterium]